MTLSCDIGRLGLLARECGGNVNACLRRLGRTTVQAFRRAGCCGAACPTVSDPKRRHADEQQPSSNTCADLRLWTNQQYAWGSVFDGVSRTPWSSISAAPLPM